MMKGICRVFGALLFGAFLWGGATVAGAQEDIAVIDYADEWTRVRGLTEGLDLLGIPYTDITDAASQGNLPLTGHRMLFLSSMYTNNPTLHQTLDNNAAVVEEFVRNGGVVIEPTQADQNEANVDWLPGDLIVVRSDPDYPEFEIVAPDHPMFNSPHRLTDDNFRGWGHQGWPTVWEVISTIEGFDTLATTRNGLTAVGEASYGSGTVVILCIAPDKYAIAGNDQNTKDNALLYLENLTLTYLPQAVSPEGLLATTWGKLRQR